MAELQDLNRILIVAIAYKSRILICSSLLLESRGARGFSLKVGVLPRLPLINAGWLVRMCINIHSSFNC